MKLDRTIFISIVMTVIILIILVSIFLHYPMNILLDSVLILILSTCLIIYSVLWYKQSDEFKLCDDKITIYKKTIIPFITNKFDLLPAYIRYFYVRDDIATFVLFDGKIVNLDLPPNDLDPDIENKIIRDLKKLKIKKVSYDRHLSMKKQKVHDW